MTNQIPVLSSSHLMLRNNRRWYALRAKRRKSMLLSCLTSHFQLIHFSLAAADLQCVSCSCTVLPSFRPTL